MDLTKAREKRKDNATKQAFLFLLAVCLSSIAQLAFAVVSPTVIPSTAQPGQINENLSKRPLYKPQSLPAITPPLEKATNKLGSEAEKITFKLNQIILSGNTVYSDKELRKLYQDKLHKVIPVAQLQEIVQSITNYYRNNGYILSRAILPPQKVANGIVHIRILEGYIDKAIISGDAKGAKQILLAYGEQISKVRPARLNVIDRYLRLANELPGVQVKGVLEPSKTNLAASNLNLVVKQTVLSGYVSYDNYGTRYVGPNQLTMGMNGNSLFRSGDTTRLTYVTTSRPQQLKYKEIAHQTPLGNRGLQLTVGANNSLSLPGMSLAALKVQGNADTFYTNLQYPALRSRDQNLTLDGGFNYLDSRVMIAPDNIPSLLYVDHLRTIKVGGSYDFADRFSAANLLGLHVEQGLGILGATHNVESTTTSRFGGRGLFTKLNLQLTRVQPIKGRFSLMTQLSGQYAFNPLLSSSQFAFGGSQLGRGYDPAEITGDRGAAGSIELHMDMAPGWFMLQTMQWYAFYDAGIVWNIKVISGTPNKQSAISTGIGTRFTLANYISGNLMIAQPLTKTVATQALVSRARSPRGFFSITVSV